MAARRSWADIPADLVAEIARHVPCLEDRVRAARACRTWLRGVLTNPCPLQLPWLLLPYQNAAALPPYATRRASFFCVLCNRAHRLAVPHYTEGARFFGAYPGGWLFLAYGQSCGHGLINLRTHESLYLPDDIIRPVGDGLARQYPMFIRAATLSAPPATFEGCVAAAIITVLTPQCFFGPSHITVWRMGSHVASASCTFGLDAEDVIHHNGAFHFLTRHGDLLICRPEFQDEAPLGRLQVREEFREMLGRVLNAGARYLVECRGELLMVLRVQPHQEATWSFRVFRMMQEQVSDADGIDADHARYGWTELPALDGRMLFVGRGCSRSFEAAHFPGSQEGVYFLDDGSFHAAPMICFGDEPRQYGCCNNGVWSGPPDHAHHWFPLQRPSTYSSPVWFLH
ncbi:hypothetical protein SETIT_3G140500v2 [Setaria italica]|uniref:KIB1-4 beta-propeller domain-containing protein n=2 Tax=Setaria italica TaxID=4555 RepID=A0A368QEQ1_SETIT|nr:uncharacterized protein LOC111256844 [Setaria italica]RCV16466.1 hypothetical protein SETIT_3G140500v2 [Setaria italica]